MKNVFGLMVVASVCFVSGLAQAQSHYDRAVTAQQDGTRLTLNWQGHDQTAIDFSSPNAASEGLVNALQLIAGSGCQPYNVHFKQESYLQARTEREVVTQKEHDETWAKEISTGEEFHSVKACESSRYYKIAYRVSRGGTLQRDSLIGLK